jgi:hypothetical protein
MTRFWLPLLLTTLLVACAAGPFKGGPFDPPPGPTFTSEMTGEQLLGVCEGKTPTGWPATPPAALRAICVVYLSGFVDGYVMKTFEMNQLRRGDLVCLPETGTNEALLRAIVARYLYANPRELAQEARVSIHVALIQEFPCS